MNFAEPHNLLYLWLLPLLVYIFLRGNRSWQGRLRRFATDKVLAILYQRRKMLARYTLLLVAFVGLVLALARPQFTFAWTEVKTKSKDLYIVVDVSQSMLADDIVPNRLERAKRKLTDLLARLTGERVSLIAFAGASFIQCPLTRDYSAAKLFLEHLHPDLIPVAGTVISEALALALNSIAENASPVGSAIILLTDGEDEGSEPLKQAQRAAAAGIKIYPIGIGSVKGVPIPDRQGNYIKDERGNLVLSKLDEQTLQKIALATGGTYVRSVHGDFDLEQVYDQGIRSVQADTTSTGERKKIWREHYYLPLLLALLALLGEFAVAVRWVVLLLGLWFVPPSLQASEAHDAFQNKNYGEAAELFRQQEGNDNLQATYNRAVSEYFDQNYQSAAEGFAQAARSKDPELANKAKFNLGNAWAAQGKFAEAIDAYNQVLQNQPDDLKAKDNLAWAKAMLEQQQNQSQQDQSKAKQNEQKQTEPREQASQAQSQADSEKPRPGEQQKQESKAQADSEARKQASQAQSQADSEARKQASQAQSQADSEARQTKYKNLEGDEAEKLLRRLDANIGVKPRFQANPRGSKQKW
ncbi:MAG: VWA domain-containing protein [Pseudomonadota bacterium]|nr:VWA domain-containing protein [Pseudomonadota bacterium]